MHEAPSLPVSAVLVTRPHFIHGAGLQSSQDLGVGGCSPLCERGVAPLSQVLGFSGDPQELNVVMVDTSPTHT